ncbi:MAG: hypothetical protein K9I85_15515 [Saprospiraceae bacterium]|nr:hypothetical protein [Saprospiraceae bacterium]
MKNGRITITVKDVMRITGKSTRPAQRIITNIKREHKKARFQPVTIGEFCAYLKIDRQEVGPLD